MLPLQSLSLYQFRCFQQLQTFHFTTPWTWVIGPNASGKTSLLEAIHVLCRLRGFRQQTLTTLKHWQSSEGKIVGDFLHPQQEQREIFWQQNRITKRIHGDLVESNRAWVQTYPIFGYRPDDDLFFHEQPESRRRYIDWVCAYANMDYFQQMTAYQHILKQRNHLLRSHAQPEEFTVWEAQLATLSSDIYQARTSVIARVDDTFRHFAGVLNLADTYLEYHPSGPQDVASIQAKLAADRHHDKERGWTQNGPHRDDLVVYYKGRPIRESGSQGLRKLAVIILALSCLLAIRPAQQTQPSLFYLDDIDGELDQHNEALLFEILISQPLQIFFTGVRKPLNLTTVMTQQITWLSLD